MHGLENIKIKESKDYMIDEVRTKRFLKLSDIEKLKAENRLLKAQTQQQQMEIDFLKNSTK